MTGDRGSALPRRRGPDLAGMAAFTLDSAGRVVSWPVSAERLFGHPASAVAGRDVCDVLMTGPGQRELAGEALAEVAAGRVWTATMSMAFAGGSGPVAVRWEPLGGPEAGVLVIGQHVSPGVGPGWLREAADRIGTTLDLPRTAREVADVAVPAFSDAVAIFVFERLLAADEPVSPQAGHGAVMRRLVARLAGQPTSVTDSVLRPGEVLVFEDESPSFRAMHTRSPVLFDRLDDESAERVARRPGGRDLTSGYASWLSVPLVAQGVVLGCATFGRAPQSPDFGPADIAAAGELASRAAVCIDNARLYHRERRTAFALQRGLLPAEPRVPAAVEVAHLYLPVGASMVGGDWHDIVALPDGRVALVVGDAMGHGPEAAAVMVQLRTATHLLAGLDLPPGELLATPGHDGRGHARLAVRHLHLRRDRHRGQHLRDRRRRSPASGAGAAGRRAPRCSPCPPGCRWASAPGPSRSPRSPCRPGPRSRCTPTGWRKAGPGRSKTASPRCATRSAPSWISPARRWTAPRRRSARRCASAARTTSLWSWPASASDFGGERGEDGEPGPGRVILPPARVVSYWGMVWA